MSNATPTWDSTTEVHLRIDNDGRMYRVEERIKPIDPSKIISSFVKNAGFLSPLLGHDTYAYFVAGEYYAIQRVRKIPFRIPMMVIPDTLKSGVPEDVRYTPAFKALSSGVDMEPPFTYLPPSKQVLLFIAGISTGYQYLLALHADTGVTYHPNLPNVFGDGRLCLGGVQMPRYSEGQGLQLYIDEAFKRWQAAKWNSDLSYEGRDIPGWLQFSPISGQNVVPSGNFDWTTRFQPIAPSVRVSEAAAAYLAARRELVLKFGGAI